DPNGAQTLGFRQMFVHKHRSSDVNPVFRKINLTIRSPRIRICHRKELSCRNAGHFDKVGRRETPT
ncbi:MAG TPA: hypothetical protein VF163_22810, partial [Micromonosporaceae bacterium]